MTFDTSAAGLITAIRSDRLPVPLAWVPTIAGMIGHETAHLMTVAIADQGHAILVAIAEAHLRRREAIEKEWIDLIIEFGGGVLPDPDDVPKIVRALRDAINDSSSTRPNIISMFTKRQTPVPIRQVRTLARALEVDAAWLVRLALRSHHPEVLDTIEETLGTVPTQREIEIIRELRALTDNRDPQLAEAVQRAKLPEFALVLTR